jgi:hypothetical protein
MRATTKIERLGAALLAVLLFGAFDPPPPYDVAALPKAWAVRQKMIDACQAKAANFKTTTEQMECLLAAHQAYAVTEKLKDMAPYRDYAAAVRHLAAEADAGKLSQYDLPGRLRVLRTDYENKVQKLWDAYYRHQTESNPGPPFDRTARAGAAASRDKAVAACGAWADAKSFPAKVTCTLAAEKRFVDAIHFQNMAQFYGYASFLMVDEVEAEDGKRTPAQVAVLHQSLWQDFQKTLDQDYGDWAKSRASQPPSK